MVFSGFTMVIGRFVRIPGSFILGAGFALKALGVADEEALLMVLINYVTTMILVAGVGLVILWQTGFDIRGLRLQADAPEAGD